MKSLVKILHKVVNTTEDIFDITVKLSQANTKQFGFLFRALTVYQKWIETKPDAFGVQGDADIDLDAIKSVLDAWNECKVKSPTL